MLAQQAFNWLNCLPSSNVIFMLKKILLEGEECLCKIRVSWGHFHTSISSYFADSWSQSPPVPSTPLTFLLHISTYPPFCFYVIHVWGSISRFCTGENMVFSLSSPIFPCCSPTPPFHSPFSYAIFLCLLITHTLYLNVDSTYERKHAIFVWIGLVLLFPTKFKFSGSYSWNLDYGSLETSFSYKVVLKSQWNCLGI